MEVIHILWSGRIGGKERAVYQLARSQLAHSRFRPAVAFGRAEGHYVEEFRKLGCPVVDLSMRRGADVLRIPSIALKLKPFAIHHFHSAEGPIMLGSALCRGATRCYTHRGGIPALGPRKATGYRLIGLLMRAAFSGLSANTHHATRAAALLTGIAEKRWAVTYNGMDFSLLDPRESRAAVAARHGVQPGDRVIIGTSANLRALKRNELLLQACAHLPEERFQLLIVGEGPDRPRLEQITNELGLERNTIFVGMQSHVGDYLALMDIFVLPSGPQESFGNSAIEAMAVGLPTLVFQDGGGLPEHIQHMQTGFIVNSVEALATELRRLLDAPELRRDVGINAARYVRDKYSLQSMVRTYDAFYQHVLDRNGAPPHPVHGPVARGAANGVEQRP